MRLSIALVTAMLCGVCGVALAADDPYARAEALAAQRQFAEAAAEYRAQLAARPRDWHLRLGLARVNLWSGRYRVAEAQFAELLAERPGDADALLGHAQSAYWWGDFRAARERFARLLRIDPDHAEARQAVGEIDLAAATRYEISARHLDDSQPYDISSGATTISWFSDPLTRWDVRAATGRVRGGEETLQSIGGGASVGLPRWRMRAEGSAALFRFPSGERELVGRAELDRRITAASSLFVAIDRDPLLGTAVSVDDAATATRTTLGWRRDPSSRWLAAITASRIGYSDDNRGAGADGWFVVPVFARGRFLLRTGLSAAWRDTDENRFRFTTFESEQIASDRWRYTYTGVYDPYWTPHDLREARLVAVAEWPRLKLHADGGYARDRALGYGPRTGPAPTPSFIVPHMQERSFNPWRISAEVRWPVTPRLELRTRYRHDVSVFYRANEFEASLGRRL